MTQVYILRKVLGPKETFRVLMRHKGYRLCGDNIDKTVRRRHLRSDRRNNISMHYFHVYAVENRIDFSNCPDVMPDNSKISDFRFVAKSLLSTSHDDAVLKANYGILISRILCKFFSVEF